MLTEKLLNIIKEHTTGDVPMAPNIIHEEVQNFLEDNLVGAKKAEEIADIVFELTSALVNSPGSYL